MRINEYPKMERPKNSDSYILDTDSGTYRIEGRKLREFVNDTSSTSTLAFEQTNLSNEFFVVQNEKSREQHKISLDSMVNYTNEHLPLSSISAFTQNEIDKKNHPDNFSQFLEHVYHPDEKTEEDWDNLWRKGWIKVFDDQGNEQIIPFRTVIYGAFDPKYYLTRVVSKEIAIMADQAIDELNRYPDMGSILALWEDTNDLPPSTQLGETINRFTLKRFTGSQFQKYLRNLYPLPFYPKASIPFSDLPAISGVKVGTMYNIKNAFVTTADFLEGSGVSFPAGTNVYCSEYEPGNKKWDCFSGPTGGGGVSLPFSVGPYFHGIGTYCDGKNAMIPGNGNITTLWNENKIIFILDITVTLQVWNNSFTNHIRDETVSKRLIKTGSNPSSQRFNFENINGYADLSGVINFTDRGNYIEVTIESVDITPINNSYQYDDHEWMMVYIIG